MAGIKTINQEQESHLQRKFNLQVAEDYSGPDDEDLTTADLATQLKAAKETTKKSQKLTAQLQKQFLGKVNIIKFLKQRSKNTVANPLRKTIYHFKKYNNLYFKNWKNKVRKTTTI